MSLQPLQVVAQPPTLADFITVPHFVKGKWPWEAVYTSSVMQRSHAATEKCTFVFYTAGIGGTSLDDDVLGAPPTDSAGCAIAFVTNTTALDARWTAIHIQPGSISSRVLSRVPKLLPHLFFGEQVAGAVYLDMKVILPPRLSLQEIVSSTLTSCGATWAAMSHPWAPFTPLSDAHQSLALHRSADPDAFQAEIDSYSNDPQFMAAEQSHRNRLIDGLLLIRDLRRGTPGRAGARCQAAHALNLAWWAGFAEGGADRDQLPFAYKLRKAALGPCEDTLSPSALRAFEASQGATDVGCGVACGQGFINIFGHSATCPQNMDEHILRAPFASTPPVWVCDLRWTRGAYTRALQYRPPEHDERKSFPP